MNPHTLLGRNARATKVLACLFALAVPISSALAYQEVDAVTGVANGCKIPIKVMIPDAGKGPFPVVFNVHGGGWNGGTRTEVPPAAFSGDAKLLCDRLGIVYVGLAYRCKAEGTFQDAMDDLHASIAWFRSRAGEFKADMGRIGFTGGSAGTPLSALLAEEMDTCQTYVGLFGGYDLVNNPGSLFPDETACKVYNIATPETKRAASAYYNLRAHPPATLLFHGAKDILINPQQSVRFGERLKAQGADVAVTIYPGINHGFYTPSNPAEFKETTLKIARLYTQYLTHTELDSTGLAKALDDLEASYFPLPFPAVKDVLGTWLGRFENLKFLADGHGEKVSRNHKVTPFTYRVEGDAIKVTMNGAETDYFLQKNRHSLYYTHTDHRFDGTKELYHKQSAAGAQRDLEPTDS